MFPDMASVLLALWGRLDLGPPSHQLDRLHLAILLDQLRPPDPLGLLLRLRPWPRSNQLGLADLEPPASPLALWLLQCRECLVDLAAPLIQSRQRVLLDRLDL